MHAYSVHTWQRDLIANAGRFVDIDNPTWQPDITWMNLSLGSPLVETSPPHAFLDGSPDLIINGLGSNDAFLPKSILGDNRPGYYLRSAVNAWLTQVRTAAGPDTAIVMVEPLVFTCSCPHLRSHEAAIAATRDSYREGIAEYMNAHPEDERVSVIRLGTAACKLALGDPYPEREESLHFGPKISGPLGVILAKQLRTTLQKMPAQASS